MRRPVAADQSGAGPPHSKELTTCSELSLVCAFVSSHRLKSLCHNRLRQKLFTSLETYSHIGCYSVGHDSFSKKWYDVEFVFFLAEACNAAKSHNRRASPVNTGPCLPYDFGRQSQDSGKRPGSDL